MTMTVVNTATGEVIEFDRAAAERRAQQIETRLTAVGESFSIAMQKIREAIEHRDDIALGYRSPGDYVSDRFGKALSGLPFEMRREAVRELTEAGLSTRAIAPVVGVSHVMVKKDQDATGVNPVNTSSPTPTPSAKTIVAPAATEDDEAEVEEPGEAVEALPTPPARPAVTGLDGKTYPRPEPKAPRRRPITDQFLDAAHDLRKVTERLVRICDEDRFPQNAEKVATANRSDLLRARDALDGVLSRLPETN